MHCVPLTTKQHKLDLKTCLVFFLFKTKPTNQSRPWQKMALTSRGSLNTTNSTLAAVGFGMFQRLGWCRWQRVHVTCQPRVRTLRPWDSHWYPSPEDSMLQRCHTFLVCEGAAVEAAIRCQARLEMSHGVENAAPRTVRKTQWQPTIQGWVHIQRISRSHWWSDWFPLVRNHRRGKSLHFFFCRLYANSLLNAMQEQTEGSSKALCEWGAGIMINYNNMSRTKSFIKNN